MRPIFSSDIGHWDVAHMHEVLPEAYEQERRPRVALMVSATFVAMILFQRLL